MKKFYFRLPKRQEKATIIVDDADAPRFRTEYWNARIDKKTGYLEIYRQAHGVTYMLGRELLGIKADDVCVIHRNEDRRDFRRANLMSMPRIAFMHMMRLQATATAPDGNDHARKYCMRGHRLTEDNLASNGKAGMICKTCKKMRQKRAYEINKALASESERRC